MGSRWWSTREVRRTEAARPGAYGVVDSNETYSVMIERVHDWQSADDASAGLSMRKSRLLLAIVVAFVATVTTC